MSEQKQGGGTPPQTGQGETPPAGDLTFDTWLPNQDDAVQGMIESHTSGLKSALQRERDARKSFENQLKDAIKAADDGSELQQQLQAMSNANEELTQKTAAYEAFAVAGISNFKLAWLAASEMGAIDKKGNVNLESLRTSYPELFGTKRAGAPAGNAGSGTGGQPPKSFSMNDAIRSAGKR